MSSWNELLHHAGVLGAMLVLISLFAVAVSVALNRASLRHVAWVCALTGGLMFLFSLSGQLGAAGAPDQFATCPRGMSCRASNS